mgnify:CR=1 FL=1
MNFPYLKRLPTYMDPVIWFLIPACIYAIYHFWNTPDKWKIVFLNWWLFSVLVFFIVTGTHAPYIIPAYVAGVVLVGILLSQTTRGETHAQIASVSGLLLTLTLSPRFGVSPLQLARRGMWNRDPTSDQLRFIGFILAIGGILLWPYISEALQSEFRIGRNVKKFIPVLVAVIIALSLAAPATFPAANTQYSTGMWVQDNVDPNEPVSVVRGSPAIHAFIFYSDRRVSPVKLNNVNNSCDCSVLVGPQSLSDNYGSEATLPVHTFGSEWTLLDLKGQKSTNRLREQHQIGYI